MATVDVDLPHVKDEDPHHHGLQKAWALVIYHEPQRYWFDVSDL